MSSPLELGASVLVIDDDPGVRAVLAIMLNLLGVSTLLTEDEGDAIEACRHNGHAPFILLGVPLGCCSIPTTLASLRRFNSAPQCCLMSPDSSPIALQKLLTFGANNVLTKPFRLQSLAAVLAANHVLTPPQKVVPIRITHLGTTDTNRPLTVLVVDDFPDVAESLVSLLRMLNHNATDVVTAREAIRVAANAQPDVVIMDYRLPDMDGMEVARRLRGVITARRPFLIATCSYWRDEDEHACDEVGVNLRLQQPLDPVALSSLLRWF